MGTSIGMLEKHYSKLKPYMKLATLSATAPTSSTNAGLEALVARQQETIGRLLKMLEYYQAGVK